MASARPPSVMMLTVCPVSHNPTSAANNANGIVVTTMMALRQSRKSSTISPVSIAPSALEGQAPDGVLDVSRLVEFKADFDVIRHERLEARQLRFDAIDDFERRGVRPLGDGM